VSGVLDRFAERVRIDAAATALVDESETLSYGELDERARRFAGWLRSAGVEPGDRVAVMLPNGAGFAACYYGTLLAGAIVVPLNHRASAERTAEKLRDCGPNLLLCERVEIARACGARGVRVVQLGAASGAMPLPELLTGAAAVTEQAARSEEDVAVVLYGLADDDGPRGVKLTYGNLAFASDAAAEAIGIAAGQGMLCGFPQFLAVGQTCAMLAVLGRGGYLVTAEQLAPGSVLTMVARHAVAHVSILPSMVRPLLGCPSGEVQAVQTLRTLLCCGGAPLDERTVRKAAKTFGCSVIEGYGPQECAGLATLSDPDSYEPESLGSAVPGTALRTTDEQGRQVPAGELGRVQLSGPMVSPGYWCRPEETEQSRWDGWLDTGDTGWLDSAGRLFLAEGPGWTRLMPGQGLGRKLKGFFGRS
jgi:long-chain acyl-CoA synthetase